MATFRVRRVFELKSRKLLVLAGTVVKGAVKARMKVVVPLNSSLDFSAPVHSVEVLRHLDGEDVCLCIACPETEQAELLSAFDVSGETLEVVDADEA